MSLLLSIRRTCRVAALGWVLGTASGGWFGPLSDFARAQPEEAASPAAQQLGEAVEGTLPEDWNSLSEAGERPFPSVLGDVIAASYLESAFLWRNAAVHFVVELGQPLELNNFESTRFGLTVGLPLASFLAGADLAYVSTESTASNAILEETPVRQVGRISRIEYGAFAELPLAEGLANNALSLLPAAQLMLSLQLRIRSAYYPGMYRDHAVEDVLTSVFLGTDLSGKQQQNLRDSRLPGMKIATSRREFLLGFRGHVFHVSGFSLSPGFLAALPSTDSSQNLGWWWEMSLGLGYAL